MKKATLIIIGVLGILIAIILVWVFVFSTNRKIEPAPQTENISDSQTQDPNPAENGQKVTVKGEVVCLPHKNAGDVITMECAFGLKGDDGRNYGLKYVNTQSPWMVDTGKRVEITGNLVTDERGVYDVIGNIEVETATFLEKN